MDGKSRLVIYPTIHVILLGDDVQALMETYGEEDERDGEAEI